MVALQLPASVTLPQEEPAQHLQGADPEGPPHVLVVDDSSTARLHIQKILSGSGLGAVIHEAADGQAALRLALTQPLDCVLCDLNMPVMDGLGFLRVVRQQRSRLELPVLILTAMDSPAERVTSLRLGASDFMVKPPEPVELVVRTQVQVQLARMHRQLQFLAERDVLTGLINGRVFLDHLHREMERGARSGTSAALLVLEVDHFAATTHEHGPNKADGLLRDLADLLRHMVRPYDVVGRLSSHGFGVMLPQVDGEGAGIVATRILNRVRASALGGLPRRAVTVSLGGALAVPPAQAMAVYEHAMGQTADAQKKGGDRMVF